MIRFLRKLARTIYWQNFYIQAKELGNLDLFLNHTELSEIQMSFLHWLSIYNSLYTDLANGEDYINEEVIDDDIRTDAYLFWRRTVKNKKETETNKNTSDTLGIPKLIFKEKKKQRK